MYALSHGAYWLLSDLHQWVFRMRCSCKPEIAGTRSRMGARVRRWRVGAHRWLWGEEGAAVAVLALAVLLVCGAAGAALFRWHHQVAFDDEEARAWRAAMGFAGEGFPAHPAVHRIVLVGRNGSGTELVQQWLERAQPAMPYVRFSVRGVHAGADGGPRAVVCRDRVARVMAEEAPRFGPRALTVVLMFREPVATLARSVREEHSAGGPLADVRSSAVRANLREQFYAHHAAERAQTKTAGFTERIIHQLTRQIHTIRQCDHAYGSEATPPDLTERFARCYTYALCHDLPELAGVSDSEETPETPGARAFSRLPARDEGRGLVRTATEDYGIAMGMYDCVFQLWRDAAAHSGTRVLVLTVEEVMSHSAARPTFERELLDQIVGSNGTVRLMAPGRLLDAIHRTGAPARYHGKGDLEYLPRKLRQRLYTLYHFHMERAAQLMDRRLYIYQTVRYTRGGSTAIAPSPPRSVP